MAPTPFVTLFVQIGTLPRERNVLTPGFSSALTCSQPTMQRGGRALGCLRNVRWPKAARHKTKENNIMKIIQKIGILSVAFCLMAGFAHAAGKSERPDATLQLSSGAVAAGVGITWGKGTLTYRGKQYPVSVSGLSVGKVAIPKVTASGWACT